jgi:hypothetical protein
MRTFTCSACNTTVYFENSTCLTCGSALGFDPASLNMVALQSVSPDGGLYRKIGRPNSDAVHYCANAQHSVCNWLSSVQDPSVTCVACDLNRTIPNLSEQGSLAAWAELERAKKRLVYSLLRFHLPLDGGGTGAGPLTFDFARDAMTGHLDGVVTVNVREADAVERERQRQIFDEPYRSLLGHLRHESGHYYWMLLVERGGQLDAFRALFNDERDDYSAALDRHYQYGAPFDWSARYVSAYASAHPWEDWAETWAHYLHMVDAVDTAEAIGMEPRAVGMVSGSTWPFSLTDAYRDGSFADLMARWIPLGLAMNTLSRSMGHNDFYPFVIPAAAYDKLAFVHRMVRNYKPQ